MKYNLLALLCLLQYSKLFCQSSPNFILILADDQGWNGTSVMMNPNNVDSKSDFYETPNLERLASMGMRFSQAYAPAPKCAPSRMSILTGQTTAANMFTNTTSRSATGEILIEPSSTIAITADALTLPEYLKLLPNSAYISAHFGKWHLGSDLPTSHGFDQSDGANSNGSGDTGSEVNDDPKQIFSLTEKGIAFMTEAKANNKSFYLQLSHYAVHTAIESTQASLTKYDAKAAGNRHNSESYAAMTEDLDTGVGLILDFLENQELMNNTYIIYTSDNGGQKNATSNEPLREGKTMVFEGGIRVPLMISGPEIAGNSHTDVPVVGYDFYPTILDLAGAALASLPDQLDGTSIKNILNGSSDELTRETPLIFHSPHYDNNANKTPRSTIIDGPNKLIVEYETGARLQYNLANDIGESTNIYSESDPLSKTLILKLRDYLREVEAQMPRYSETDLDTDADGLPDAWEFVHLLGTQYDGNDDPDSDGINNLSEFKNDSDPLVISKAVALFLEEKVPFDIYPNPNTGTIHFMKVDDENHTFKLFGIDGKMIISEVLNPDTKTLNLTNHEEGIYLYGIYDRHDQITSQGKLISL